VNQFENDGKRESRNQSLQTSKGKNGTPALHGPAWIANATPQSMILESKLLVEWDSAGKENRRKVTRM
jgi:hypothetical protein